MTLNKPWLTHYDRGIPERLDYLQVGLVHFLENSGEKYPDRACTILGDTPITFRQMDQLTTNLAHALVGLGLRIGDRVGLFLPNLPQFVALYYAILKAGGVVVAINPQYKAREMEYQVSDSGVKMLALLEESYEMVSGLRERTALQHLLVTRVEDGYQGLNAFLSGDGEQPHYLPHPDDIWLNQLSHFGQENTRLPEVSPDDVAIYQYTGGTTGIPKGAIGLHRNLVANTLQFRSWLVNLHQGDEVMLAALPLFHVYGMVLAMSLGIALGAPLVLIPNARNMDSLLSSIEKYRTTIFPGVPTMYNAINRDPGVQAGRYNLSSIKACISGSAPLLRETKERFEALTGGKLVEGYGLSEAPTATHCNPILGENRTGSIGLPLPDVEAKIVSLEDQLSTLLPGEIGELVLRGPQVMAGYHDRVEETNTALRNGWLYTGDIARMDKDGYFYIVDRKKEMIKVSGFQVWPREVEEVLAAHPAVLDVGVAGVPEPMRGETVKAWVVLKPGAEVKAQVLLDWCAENLAYFKVPSEIEFRQELPKTTVGKVLRRELRREHMEKNKNQADH